MQSPKYLVKSLRFVRITVPVGLLIFGALMVGLTPKSASHAQTSTCTQDVVPTIPEDLDEMEEEKVRINPYKMTMKEFKKAAAMEFNRCHRRISKLESVPSQFRANVDFPSKKPDNRNLPWMSLHPIKNPKQYLDTVLKYAMDGCGADHIDWDGNLCGWYHAPWMHNLREPINGLTQERSSRLGELHPSQTTKAANWAISLYNDVGGHAFHQMWNDKTKPRTKGFEFDHGTVAIKLLFSLATPEEVPYLRFAKTWDIHNGEKIVKARLVQVDIAIKDYRVTDDKNAVPNKDLTGWIMGSYLYNGSIETTPRCDKIAKDIDACEQARWRKRLVPIGVQWGNDPQMYGEESAFDGKSKSVPVQHWLNDQVSTMFSNVRTMSGHPSYLGRDGRMNGPVDNHRSTCLACHGRAVDFGKHEPEWPRYVPFAAEDNATNEVLQSIYFRNLNGSEPFVEGTQSLDYSLQAAVGLRNFREWVESQRITRDMKNDTSDFVPTYNFHSSAVGDLTIATWNIANLHHETDEPLRRGAKARREIDFQRLREFAQIHLKDATIIGLQEIGSLTALRRILSEEKYHLIMSDRYNLGDEFRPSDERGIYNAIAISKDKFPKQPKTTTLDAFALRHIQYDHHSDFGENRSTRAAMSVEFEYEGQKISFLNVHLKSRCHHFSLLPIEDQKNEQSPYASRFSCRTLDAQLSILENWIELEEELGSLVIVAGDFNRKLNKPKKKSEPNEAKKSNSAEENKLDDFWKMLNDKTPNGLVLVKGPKGMDGVCWPNHFKGDPKHHISFIVADNRLVSELQSIDIKAISMGYVDAKEYAKKYRERLSDHCPVMLTLSK